MSARLLLALAAACLLAGLAEGLQGSVSIGVMGETVAEMFAFGFLAGGSSSMTMTATGNSPAFQVGVCTQDQFTQLPGTCSPGSLNLSQTCLWGALIGGSAPASATDERVIDSDQVIVYTAASCTPEGGAGTFSFITLNPGGQQLSSDMITNRQLDVAMWYMWLPLTGMLFAAWLSGRRLLAATRLHMLLLTVAILQSVAALGRVWMWNYIAQTGTVDSEPYLISDAVSAVSDAAQLLGIMCVVLGYGLTHARFIGVHRAALCSLPLLQLIGQFTYNSGGGVICAVLLVCALLLVAGRALDFARIEERFMTLFASIVVLIAVSDPQEDTARRAIRGLRTAAVLCRRNIGMVIVVLTVALVQIIAVLSDTLIPDVSGTFVSGMWESANLLGFIMTTLLVWPGHPDWFLVEPTFGACLASSRASAVRSICCGLRIAEARAIMQRHRRRGPHQAAAEAEARRIADAIRRRERGETIDERDVDRPLLNDDDDDHDHDDHGDHGRAGSSVGGSRDASEPPRIDTVLVRLPASSAAFSCVAHAEMAAADEVETQWWDDDDAAVAVSSGVGTVQLGHHARVRAAHRGDSSAHGAGRSATASAAWIVGRISDGLLHGHDGAIAVVEEAITAAVTPSPDRARFALRVVQVAGGIDSFARVGLASTLELLQRVAGTTAVGAAAVTATTGAADAPDRRESSGAVESSTLTFAPSSLVAGAAESVLLLSAVRSGAVSR